jgi:AraC-like DNA-binding protein
MSYIEHLVASPLLCCTWEQTAPDDTLQRVVPDACVDLIWNGETLPIAGPDTRARLVPIPAGTPFVGARLRPGAAGAALALPADELRDVSPDAADVLGRDTCERLLEALAAGAEPHALLRGALEAPRARLDPLVRAAISALDRPGARVAGVAAELGVSSRQLQRRVSAAVGYGPKTLACVLWFRRVQALGEGRLVDLALDAGYADQAHMTTEVTRLAGVPPVRFLKDRTPTAA